MRQFIGKGEMGPALVREPPRQIFEQRVILAVALTENDELNVPFQEVLGDQSQQVPALLRNESANLRQQRDFGSLGQASPSLQPGFANRLAGHNGCRVVVARDLWRMGGTPHPRVYPVDNSLK